MTPARFLDGTPLRSLLKAVSRSCVDTLDPSLVRFVVLRFSRAAGNVAHAAKVASGGVADVEIPTEVPLCYLHERAGGRITFGQQPRPVTLAESAAEIVP